MRSHLWLLCSLALLGGLAGCSQPSAGGPEADMARYCQAHGESAGSQTADAGPGLGWFQLGTLLSAAQDGPAPTTVEADGEALTVDLAEDELVGPAYLTRRGPAYRDDFWRSAGRDAKELPASIWYDSKQLIREPIFWVGMGVAGVAGIAINATGVDETVADQTDGHRHLNKTFDGIGGFFGSPAVHFPLAGAMYAAGYYIEDDKLFETSKTLINALAINGIITQGLKWAVRTESPNGDELGWPSGHTSSTFTFATVMYRAYGPYVGVPLLAFAGFVGYERIDARNHDFSDVISGMVIGITVGYLVGNEHEHRIFGMEPAPYVDPETGAFGLALRKEW